MSEKLPNNQLIMLVEIECTVISLNNPFMVRHARVCSRTSTVQLVRAAVRLLNAFTKSKSSSAKKIIHADMQLSSWSDDCWSSHILSAMNSLTQSFLFKERLLKCQSIDLGRFLVDLRDRHLDH